MIEGIELHNFKGFRKLKLDNLAGITLLGGENSIGKTSILEAVFMFFDRGSPEMVFRHFGWRGISKTYLSADQIFSPIFHRYDKKETATIVLRINGREEKLRISFKEKLAIKRASFEITGKRRLVASNEDKPVVNGKLDIQYVGPGGQSEDSELIVTEKGFKLKDRSNVTLERRPAIYLSPRIPGSPSEDAQRFGVLDRQNEVGGAVEFLQKFDKRIKGLSSIFFGDSALIHADVAGHSQKIPLPQLGEGLSFAMAMYLAISAAKDGVLLVDEIGAGIHHSIMPTLWGEISEACEHFKCQLIATTHSYECMEAAAEGLKSLEEPDFAYIRLEREGNSVVANPYTFPVLEAALSSGWEVR